MINSTCKLKLHIGFVGFAWAMYTISKAIIFLQISGLIIILITAVSLTNIIGIGGCFPTELGRVVDNLPLVTVVDNLPLVTVTVEDNQPLVTLAVVYPWE